MNQIEIWIKNASNVATHPFSQSVCLSTLSIRVACSPFLLNAHPPPASVLKKSQTDRHLLFYSLMVSSLFTSQLNNNEFWAAWVQRAAPLWQPWTAYLSLPSDRVMHCHCERSVMTTCCVRSPILASLYALQITPFGSDTSYSPSAATRSVALHNNNNMFNIIVAACLTQN